MGKNSCVSIIKDQTERALWEVQNVIDCIPDNLWNTIYGDMPMWKHVYHMLHSLDLWFINPRDKKFEEPLFHTEHLNNLDVYSENTVTREVMEEYYSGIKEKIRSYLDEVDDEELLLQPSGCEYDRFTLMLAQHRHLHSHMGMIMGFIIKDIGLWPRVIGLEKEIPKNQNYEKYDLKS